MPQWTALFDLPLPGWKPLRLAATSEAAVVLTRGRLLDEGSGGAPWATFELRLICYDLVSRTPHWEYSLQGPDTMWQLHIGRDGVLLWDEMGSGAWLHKLPDGARRELPSELHNGETLTLSSESVWRYDGTAVEALDPQTAKVRGSWQCKAWHPTAARVADGHCWLACVSERNMEDHALLCIDPGQAQSTLITELPLVENLTHLVVTPDLVVIFGSAADPATAVELPDELRDLERLTTAANQHGVRGLVGKARLYKTLLSDLPGFLGTMGVLHETATGALTQPVTLSAMAVRRADRSEQWRQTLTPAAPGGTTPGGTTEHRVTPTAREGSVFAAIAQEVFTFDADTGAVAAHQFAGTLLALPDEAQPCAWVGGEDSLTAWQLME